MAIFTDVTEEGDPPHLLHNHTLWHDQCWLQTRIHRCYWGQMFCTHKAQTRISIESEKFQPSSPGPNFTGWLRHSISGVKGILQVWAPTQSCKDIFFMFVHPLYRKDRHGAHVERHLTLIPCSPGLFNREHSSSIFCLAYFALSLNIQIYSVPCPFHTQQPPQPWPPVILGISHSRFVRPSAWCYGIILQHVFALAAHTQNN